MESKDKKQCSTRRQMNDAKPGFNKYEGVLTDIADKGKDTEKLIKEEVRQLNNNPRNQY